MAAGDSQVYGIFARDLMKGDNAVDFDTATLKMLLTTSSYTPDVDADQFYSDVTNELANGDGYSTGGATASTGSVTYDSANNRAEYDCADFSWAFTATKAPKYAVLYKDTGSASTSPLIAYWDCGTVSTDMTFTLTVNTEGLVQFRATAQTA